MSDQPSHITAVSGEQNLVDTTSSFINVVRPRILSTVEEMRLPFSFRFPDGPGNKISGDGASVTILKRSRPSSRPPSHATQPSSPTVSSATENVEESDNYDSEDEEVWLGDDRDYPSDVEVVELPPIDGEKQAALLAKSREVAYNEWLNATQGKVSNTQQPKKRKLPQPSSIAPTSAPAESSDDTASQLQDMKHLLLHLRIPDIESSLLMSEVSSTGSRRYKNHWVHYITEANPLSLTDLHLREIRGQSEVRQLQLIRQLYRARMKHELEKGFDLAQRWCENIIAMLDVRLKELGAE